MNLMNLLTLDDLGLSSSHILLENHITSNINILISFLLSPLNWAVFAQFSQEPISNKLLPPFPPQLSFIPPVMKPFPMGLSMHHEVSCLFLPYGF